MANIIIILILYGYIFFWDLLFLLGRLLFLVCFKMPFFWYCLPEMVVLEGLRNLVFCELEDIADFKRILVLMCFLSDNLA